MNIPSTPSFTKQVRRGFTLVELLVALAITAVIVAMLVTITATALDGFTTSRNQVKAAREAKSAFDQLSRDLESLVVRADNNFEWLWVATDSDAPGPNGNTSPSSAQAVFFTAATDRYNGQLNTQQDRGGDVSTAAYKLLYRDPVSNSENPNFSSFVLYRQLINPDETFNQLLAKEDLQAVWRQGFESSLSDSSNFVCENIYEFSLSFVIEYVQNEVTQTQRIMVLNSGGANSVNDFRLRGNGISANGNTNADYADGRVIAADLSLTVINDTALEALRGGGLPAGTRDAFLERNSYHYSRTILLPQP